MPVTRPISVVILYSHPLLGEGLARMLSAEPDLDVCAVAVHTNVEADVVARSPDVVIVERGVRPAPADLLDLSPGTLFIEFGMDTGLMYAYQRDQIPARPGGILRAIRHVRRVAGTPASSLLALSMGLSAAVLLAGV